MPTALTSLELSIETVGTLSAVVMFLGYILYGYFLLIGRTRANATAWGLMCVSATSFLVVEFLYGVPINALKLGLVDALVAFVIVAIAYASGRIVHWSTHDKKLVLWYIGLLTLYLLGDGAKEMGLLENYFLHIASVGIILLYNATMVIEFIPIIRETLLRNEDEVPWPWFVWTLSYGLYVYVRILENVDPINLVYPISSVILHGTIALITIPILWRSLHRTMLRRKKSDAINT